MSETKTGRMYGGAVLVLLVVIAGLLAYPIFSVAPSYEYRFGKLGDSGGSAATLANEINELARDGWELQAMEVVSWTGDDAAPTEIRAALRRVR